ncbi:MAG: ribonuclease [Sphingobacteriales bacterium]|jgi:hypothetical protein|nr:ribonuclease [Sphingobacteriales bacterium]
MQLKSNHIIILLLVVIIGIMTYNSCSGKMQPNVPKIDSPNTANTNKINKDIDELTKEEVVVSYVEKNKKLPEYYITKKEAREKGWNASDGNLCDILPGRAIGGDIFSNREGKLPAQNGRTWYEADLNYNCGRRNADRILFSNDGMIFVTHDHYQNFIKK